MFNVKYIKLISYLDDDEAYMKWCQSNKLKGYNIV